MPAKMHYPETLQTRIENQYVHLTGPSNERQEKASPTTESEGDQSSAAGTDEPVSSFIISPKMLRSSPHKTVGEKRETHDSTRDMTA
ncbi:hypothetical protein HHI36_002697 [Cryptolaemus montrouzieri]|uniref:Uncharacterized protein n=1 Tax=Cryptolaemus montrouzieri TaxID=559131 RepID=A0ABD2PC23_9CUCU